MGVYYDLSLNLPNIIQEKDSFLDKIKSLFRVAQIKLTGKTTFKLKVRGWISNNDMAYKFKKPLVIPIQFDLKCLTIEDDELGIYLFEEGSSGVEKIVQDYFEEIDYIYNEYYINENNDELTENAKKLGELINSKISAAIPKKFD